MWQRSNGIGHHRRGSMRLYSRDDTAGQLALQATLVKQVRKGYRFVTPLHRGSQTPLIEPAVTLGYKKEYAEFRWSFFTSISLRRIHLCKGFQYQFPKNQWLWIMTVTAAVLQHHLRAHHRLRSGGALKRLSEMRVNGYLLVIPEFNILWYHVMIPANRVWMAFHYRAACGVRSWLD